MFYNDQPVDWLFEGIVKTKVCAINPIHKVSKLFMVGINGL